MGEILRRVQGSLVVYNDFALEEQSVWKFNLIYIYESNKLYEQWIAYWNITRFEQTQWVTNTQRVMRFKVFSQLDSSFSSNTYLFFLNLSIPIKNSAWKCQIINSNNASPGLISAFLLCLRNYIMLYTHLHYVLKYAMLFYSICFICLSFVFNNLNIILCCVSRQGPRYK